MSIGTIFVFRWELPSVGLEEARTIAFSMLVSRAADNVPLVAGD
jgi:hypothetical protein